MKSEKSVLEPISARQGNISQIRFETSSYLEALFANGQPEPVDGAVGVVNVGVVNVGVVNVGVVNVGVVKVGVVKVGVVLVGSERSVVAGVPAGENN